MTLTGASPHTVKKRVAFLTRGGYLAQKFVPADLRQPDGANVIRATQTKVYYATPRGARLAGRWAVAGYDHLVGLAAPGRKVSTDHTLAVADLVTWYTAYGCDVATEREIRSVEVRDVVNPKHGKVRTHPALGATAWAVRVPGRVDVHPADAGVIHPDGTRWAIEIERTTKSRDDYRDTIAALRDGGLGQVWHVLTKPTMERLFAATASLGIMLDPNSPKSCTRSTDGQIRFQWWAPGRSVGHAGPEAWRGHVPRIAPAGFDLPLADPAVVRAEWELGRVVDLEQEYQDPGNLLVA